MTDLKSYGWDEFFSSQLSETERSTWAVARIVEPLRGLSRAVCQAGEIWAEHTEKSASGAKSRKAVPATGDWVLGSLRQIGGGELRMQIERVLTRKNKLSRAAPGGKNYEQILCTNVDVAFLVLAISQNFHEAGMARYLEIFSENKIQPVIVVTKMDEAASHAEVLPQIIAAAQGLPVIPVSVKENSGLEPLAPYFIGNKTVVLLGASGAGKSSLVNFLLGEELRRVESVRESDQKGRHTTTGRRLLALPSGGMVIDSPGIREIQKWEGKDEAPQEPIKKKNMGPRPPRYQDDEDY